MKKLFSLSLVFGLLLSLCLFVSGCGLDPSTIEVWYIKEIEKDGEVISLSDSLLSVTDNLYCDDYTIKFNNGNCEFYLKGQKLIGSYKLKNKDHKTEIDIAFNDGSSATGYSVSGYGFDKCEITYNGVRYVFSDKKDQIFLRNEKNTFLKEKLKNIFDDFNLTYSYSDQVFNVGEIKEENGVYTFTYSDGLSPNFVLDKDSKFYYYDLDSDFNFTKIDNVKSGKCILGQKRYLSPNEQLVYAIYYLNDCTSSVLPFTKTLNTNDIEYFNRLIYSNGSGENECDTIKFTDIDNISKLISYLDRLILLEVQFNFEPSETVEILNSHTLEIHTKSGETYFLEEVVVQCEQKNINKNVIKIGDKYYDYTIGVPDMFGGENITN